MKKQYVLVFMLISASTFSMDSDDEFTPLWLRNSPELLRRPMTENKNGFFLIKDIDDEPNEKLERVKNLAAVLIKYRSYGVIALLSTVVLGIIQFQGSV